jgi:hypothetical protein
MPRRVPELSAGLARQGRGMDAASRQRGRKPLLPIPAESEERTVKRHPGRLFFGYFLLAEQKKVPRLSVREPTSK